MWTPLLWLLLLGGLALLWQVQCQAHELAVQIARQACQARGWVWLDEAVALQRIRVRWQTRPLTLDRCYGFEFSDGTNQRYRGQVILLGRRLHWLWLEGEWQAGANDPPSLSP